jgi:dUTP pyrophosphatase
MKVNVKKLHPDAVIPSYAYSGDACFDLTAVTKEVQNDLIIYGTGLAIQVPLNHVGLIFQRSSVCKKDIILSNCVGVVDQYIGEIKFFYRDNKFYPLAIYEDLVDIATKNEIDYLQTSFYLNSPSEHYEIGDRIGQMMIIERPKIEFEEVDELVQTDERGVGGFGSSGK